MDYAFQCLNDDYEHIKGYFKRENDMEITSKIDLSNNLTEFIVSYIGNEYNKNNGWDTGYDKYIKMFAWQVSTFDKICKNGYRVINPSCSDVNSHYLIQQNIKTNS